MVDQYFKTVNIEGETTEWVAQTQILPGVLNYLHDLATTASRLPVASVATSRTIEQIASGADALSNALEHLRAMNLELGGDSVHEKAQHMNDRVLPAMLAVRTAADQLERVMAYKHWPLPGYREMLFVK
jgi:glutamine synthetase